MRNIKCLFVAFLFFINTNAQEIGIAPVKIWTDNKEIKNPYGLGVYIFQSIGRFGIKAEYVAAKNSRTYYGLLNGGFLIAPEDFLQDSISSKSTFRAIELSVYLTKLLEIFENHLNIGAGISFDKFTRVKTGLTSRKRFETYENKFGIFYAISVSRHNIFNSPLKLELLFKHKGLMSGNYATDTEQPFTGTIGIKELQLNFAFMF
ncbi:MAG: hypothetical protein CVV23_13070 [Ignavibacteriae bacterium HGW-Ignavibacteriae-2]|jgi:hypothetical protein|nr:MAG: hypothetical protein CVV23_13070 [Ignavibacteriae bacterium HGW-Ignavibacteriae-2]